MIHLTEELWQAAKKDVPLKNTLIFKTPERFGNMSSFVKIRIEKYPQNT